MQIKTNRLEKENELKRKGIYSLSVHFVFYTLVDELLNLPGQEDLWKVAIS